MKLNILKIAAFSDGEQGGNPAGVWIGDALPDEATMQKRANKVERNAFLLVHAQTSQLFHTRNAFASGGVYEDPATGAATAAFAGYLRDINWPHGGEITIIQGEDMGCRSLLHAHISSIIGSSIRVSGTARIMKDISKNN